MHYQGFLAAMSPGHHYDLDNAIAEFFAKTSTSREACDAKALTVVGGSIKPVTIQGNCSYTVYAGKDLEYVFQFRFPTLPLNMDVLQLARRIHGPIVPPIDSLETLDGVHVYRMPRQPYRSYLDYVLANEYPQNSMHNFAFRATLMEDIARFFAVSWNSPQAIAPEISVSLRSENKRDLELLLHSFPSRFHETIQACNDNLDDIASLPVVLLHRDFSTANLLVEWNTGHLASVLDWGEAGLCPFGQNLHFIQNLICVLDAERGWQPYDDYEALQEIFWDGLKRSANMSARNMKIIKLASVMGLLLYRGFTRRLAGMAQPTPISEDPEDCYSFQYLDAFLLNSSMKIIRL